MPKQFNENLKNDFFWSTELCTDLTPYKHTQTNNINT